MIKTTLKLAGIAMFGLSSLTAVASEDDDVCHSYTAKWSVENVTHRSIMFPHEIEGCKIMIQSVSWQTEDGEDKIIEREGADCNCDLLIDGFEELYEVPPSYNAERMLEVCSAPGIDGLEQGRAENRNVLKLEPAPIETLRTYSIAEIPVDLNTNQ